MIKLLRTKKVSICPPSFTNWTKTYWMPTGCGGSVLGAVSPGTSNIASCPQIVHGQGGTISTHSQQCYTENAAIEIHQDAHDPERNCANPGHRFLRKLSQGRQY